MLKTKNLRGPLAIDAFAGAGGLALGLQRAGFDVCLSYDFDEKAVSSYRKNIDDRILLADARKIDIKEHLKSNNINPEDIVLFAGGPPCQGFSIQRRGEDKDDRNNLVRTFFKQALSIRPPFILMENVLGLNGHRGKALISFVTKTCSNAGYVVHMSPMNAAAFGVPQSRRRFFIVAERKSGDFLTFKFPKPLYAEHQYRTVRDAIGDLPPPPTDGSEHQKISNHRSDVLSDLNRRRFEHVPAGGGRADIPKHLQLKCHQVSVEKAGHRYVYGRLSWDSPSGVITARFDSLTRGRFGHPEQTRSLSLREGARLQTFPDSFVFVGNKVDIARQIGNAVPPMLGTALGRAIMSAWNIKQKQRNRSR